MKRFLILPALSVLVLACNKEVQPSVTVNEDAGVITFSSEFTKVVTNSGVSTWEANDSISVFGLENGAAAGTSVNGNVIYKTAEGGASVTFSPKSESVSAADKYVAYYPGFLHYPFKLNADSSIGFAGVAASDAVTDYRFMPVSVTSGYNASVNAETRTANINTKSFFYAVADAPETPETKIGLSFTPVLPVLEFGFLGKGTITKFTAEYADKTVDVIGDDKSNWLNAKGVFNACTGILTTTNSNNSYHQITAKLVNPVELSATEATRFPMTVGRFKVTKGLNLTFTDGHGNTFTKTIWTDETKSGLNTEGKCVHLYQRVNVPYLVADNNTLTYTAAGGSADVVLETTAGDWSVESKPEWITLSQTTGSSCTISVSAAANSGAARDGEIVLVSAAGPKCYIDVSQDAAPTCDWYKVSASTIDWTSSKIQYVCTPTSDTLAIVTKELKEKAKTDLVVNLYKGKDFTAMQTASEAWYISADGNTVTAEEPSGTVGDASFVPMYLTSPSGENNPLVKVGARIFTINGYKTTKCGDGTELTQLTTPVNNSKKRAVYKNADYYIYNGYGVGATLPSSQTAEWAEGFAPDGWSMIDATTWSNIVSFIGGDNSSAYSNFMNSGLFTRNTYKYNGQLSYVNTWSSVVSGAKLKMWMVQSGKAPTSSDQGLSAMFEVIVFKKVQ